MDFDCNMKFKDFYDLLNEAGRSRSSGGRSDEPAPDVEDRPNSGISSGRKPPVGRKGKVRSGDKGGGAKTRGELAATPEFGSVTATERGKEDILDPRKAASVTGATYSTAKAVNREMDEEVKIPKELVEQLKKMYPDSSRFSESIVKSNIGTTLNAMFASYGELAPSQMTKTIQSGPVSEYVDILIDGYKKLFPESIITTDKGEYITTITKDAEHFKYGAPYESDPKFKKIYSLTTKRLFRELVKREGQSPRLQTVNFPEYSTFKLQDIGGQGSAVQQRSAYFGTASQFSGPTKKK